MNPKIETINIAYFIPGVILVVGVGGGCVLLCMNFYKYEQIMDFLKGLSSLGAVTGGAIFLAIAYVGGYGMWALGDIVYRTVSDNFIFKRMFFYLGMQKILRERFRDIARYGECERIIEVIDKLKYDLCNDDEKQKREQNENTKLSNMCSKQRYDNNVEKLKEKVGRLLDEYYEVGPCMRWFCWNQIYNSNNEYHVGRFLSDWNNVKFAKATMCSFLVGVILNVIVIMLVLFLRELGWLKVEIHIRFWSVWNIVLIVLGVLYFPVVKWRLRAYARDLVHGLAPDLTKKGRW